MVRWSNIYGVVERRYRETCRLTTQAGDFQGPFECVQLGDGGIYIQIEAGDRPEAATVFESTNFDSVTTIRGTTLQGKSFEARPLMVTHISQRFFGAVDVLLRFVVSEAVIGEPDTVATRRRYGLTNFAFVPNKSRMATRSLRTCMQFETGESESIVVRRVPQYDEIFRMLRAQHACAVTCVGDSKATEEEFDQFCFGVSLAQGTIVNWIWRDDYHKQKRVRTVLSNRRTGPYTGLPVLPHDRPQCVPNFIGQVFRRIPEVFEKYSLSAVFDLLVQAKYSPASFLAHRGLMLAIALEILATAYGNENSMTVRMPPRDYNRGKRKWEPQVREAIALAYPERDDLTKMMESIRGGLNRFSFGERIRSMGEEFGVYSDSSLLDEQVRKVTSLRNSLVHAGAFKAKDQYGMIDEFFFLMSFTERLLLKLLGYSGQYRVYENRGFTVKELP